ncbi:hypothetical protein NIES4071_104120 (plasmid) [Calothrix sp. NIES-4071]|nr:hypothetical protein NIES4071_104120 [Calothrix sp. NIES-4071]BAZ64399.1 hypothetical protein NIES4105_101320 [Calothrix sp. NIES-4105]
MCDGFHKKWKDKEYNPFVSTLFGSYHNSCRGAGEKAEGLNAFSPLLLDLCQKVLGYKYVHRDRDNASRRGFSGIRLRCEGEKQISHILTFPDKELTTPPKNPQSSIGKHSDNPDNLLDKKIMRKKK